MWALIFVYYFDSVPYIEEVSKHTDMVECFYARESLAAEVGKGDGYFKPGQQAICVSLGGEET